MSKNITIQEGGVARNFGNVAKLQTELVGGGSCYWVPEEETKTTTKHITENGTYKAASDDAYGYSEVTVNVRGGNGSADSHGVPTISGGTPPGGIGSSVIGKDPETGNDVAVGVDEDGNLVQTPVPSYIKVTRPPDKTEYVAGQTINPTGIIVHAYLADGTDFGTVLNSELVYPEPVAPEGGGEQSATSELDTGTPQPIIIGDTMIIKTHGGSGSSAFTYTHTYTGAVFALTTFGDNYFWVAASSNPDETFTHHVVGVTDATGNVFEEKTYTEDFNFGYTYDGKKVWYAQGGARLGNTELIQPTPNASDNRPNRDPVAWTIIYGDIEGGTAEIPVQWKSPYDGREFEDTFEITVTGGTGGGGTTVDDGGFSGGGGTF